MIGNPSFHRGRHAQGLIRSLPRANGKRWEQTERRPKKTKSDSQLFFHRADAAKTAKPS
jgi:hypothetical protein